MSKNGFQNARKLHRMCNVSHEDRVKELMRAYTKATGETATRDAALDWATGILTAFKTFADMVNAGGYRPTLRPDIDWRHLVLGVEYDMTQEARDDKRRAYMPGIEFNMDGTAAWNGEFSTSTGWRSFYAAKVA